MKKLILTLLICFLPCYGWCGVDFDDVDDWIQYGLITALDDDADFSLSVWINSNDITPAASEDIIAKRFTDAGIDTSPGSGWELNINTTGTVRMIFVSNTNIISTGTISTGWNHLAVTYDATSDAVEIYINGVNDGSGTSLYSTNSERITVGNINAAGSSRDYGGQITEVAIWETVLTQAEITLLANSRTKRMPLQIQPSTLQIYSPLDDGSDGTANCFNGSAGFKDLSGNGNDGTGDDGLDNIGLTCKAEEILTYN